MSELDDFLAWGAGIRDNPGTDSFGRKWANGSFGHFPYGTISAWIHEYRYAKGSGARGDSGIGHRDIREAHRTDNRQGGVEADRPVSGLSEPVPDPGRRKNVFDNEQ